MPPLQSRRSERCEILHILDLFCAAAPKPLCHLEFITVHLKRKMCVAAGWKAHCVTITHVSCSSSCLVVLWLWPPSLPILLGISQCAKIFWNIVLQWEIGILLRIFAGFTTTKAFKKSIIKCGHIPRHYLWQSMLLIYYIFKSSVFERLCCVVSKPPKISSWTSTYIFDLIRWLAMALFSRRFEFFFACYLTYICIWNT